MKIALITGSSGLIGGEAVDYFAPRFDLILGIDNNLRAYFFGESSSTAWNTKRLTERHANYRHQDMDIRDKASLENLFSKYGSDISLIIHSAAQPSHDWAAREPITDFSVNALGTVHLLELTRLYCPEAVFIFTSTNKVYGDSPNLLPLNEEETRWELPASHIFHGKGIDETMSIDRSKHSVFGASKVAADIMVQEYGSYFGLKTGVFRGGCLTGPNHSGAPLHGFLAYLMQCAITQKQYTIFGYQGKQVRDNIHSLDLIRMFDFFYQNPGKGEVYNAGGGRENSCSVLEAIALCEKISGNSMHFSYSADNRIGDHIWYISNTSRFESHYPQWKITRNLESTLTEMHDVMSKRYETISHV